MTFNTERLQLAIFLHGTQRLRLAHCETVGNGKVRFVFEDPDSQAEQDVSAYLRGEVVPALEIVNAQRDLKDLLYRTKDIGDSRNGYRRR